MAEEGNDILEEHIEEALHELEEAEEHELRATLYKALKQGDVDGIAAWPKDLVDHMLSQLSLLSLEQLESLLENPEVKNHKKPKRRVRLAIRSAREKEAERAAKEAERAAKEAERAAKEAAIAEKDAAIGMKTVFEHLQRDMKEVARSTQSTGSEYISSSKKNRREQDSDVKSRGREEAEDEDEEDDEASRQETKKKEDEAKKAGGHGGTTSVAWFYQPKKIETWELTPEEIKGAAEAMNVELPASIGSFQAIDVPNSEGNQLATRESDVAAFMGSALAALRKCGVNPREVLAKSIEGLAEKTGCVARSTSSKTELSITVLPTLRYARPDDMIVLDVHHLDDVEAEDDRRAREGTFDNHILLKQSVERDAVSRGEDPVDNDAQNNAYFLRRCVFPVEYKQQKTLNTMSFREYCPKKPKWEKRSQRVASHHALQSSSLRGPAPNQIAEVKDSLAQACMYMVATNTMCIALTDGVVIYLVRRNRGGEYARTIWVTPPYFLDTTSRVAKRNGHSNDYGVTAAQALVFGMHLGIIDFCERYKNDGKLPEIDWEWVIDEETKVDVERYRGDTDGSVVWQGTTDSIRVPTAHASGAQAENPPADAACNSLELKQRQSGVFSELRLNARELVKHECFYVLQGEGHGYADVNIGGLSCFVKTVPDDDSEAVMEAREELMGESRVYDALKSLQGTAIPRKVFYGTHPVHCRAALLAVTSEGFSLASRKGLALAARFKDLLLPGAKGALGAMHGECWLHKDVALRNVVINDRGDIKMIDLGRSTKRKFSQRKAAAEMGKLEDAVQNLLEDLPVEDGNQD